MITLRAINDNGVKVDLDVMDVNQPLKLDISAIENGTIGSVFGVSSQTFSLPGTDKNNQFFGNLFDLGVDGAVALENSIDCQLLTDGQEVFAGKLYITDIITDQKGYTTYQVNLVNETVDLKFVLENTLLRELDWSAYNHSYTYGNITSSWDYNLVGGDIVYPHVNYGAPEGDTGAPNWSFSNNPSQGGFDIVGAANSRPLRVIDFKPAIRAKAVVDTIFESAGYSYTSSFFDSSYFENLYVLTTANEGLGVANENPTTGSFWAYRTSNQVFNALTDTKITFPVEIFDNLGAYSTGSSQYTAYAGGGHYFALGFQFSISSYNINNRLRFVVSLKNGSGGIVASRVFVDPPQSGQLYAPFITSLAVGEIAEVYLELISDDGSETVTIGSGQNNTYFRLVQGPASIIGATANVNIGAQFDNDITSLDFLDGLIQKFNLVIEPIPNQRNVLRIEPFQDWVDLGVTKDWTDKVDRNTRFQITHPISEQPKTIIFRDEDDEASINKYTKDNFGEVFGTYVFSNDSDLAQGERVVGKLFAALPVKNIPLSRDFIIPTLASKEANSPERPFKFKPRLVYANGKKSVGSEAYGLVRGSNTNLSPGFIRGTYFMRDENQDDHRMYYWFQVSTLSDIPSDFDSTKDLHFGNNKLPGWYQYFQPTGINGKTKNGAFHTYWETYINSLYDIDARKLTCNVWLKPTEIQDIALNDKIFIDGHYYRINKISGANISEEESVEVELIKQLNRKLVYPRRRITVGTTTLDLQIQNESVNGSVSYIDYETGDIVVDAGFVSQAGPKDGYQVYETGGTGSAIWDYKPQSNIALEKSVFGANEVSDEATRVSVNGQNNTIKDQVSEATIIGSNNTIGEFTDTSLVSGFGNIIDIDQSNNFIISSLNGIISSSTDNSGILGGSASAMYNGDWVQIINSEKTTVRDSDYTTVINGHNNEVVLNGSGHLVLGLNKEGAGLDLLDYRNNSNYLGDTYMGGAIFNEFKQLECGDGVTINLYDTQYLHDNTFVLNWSGLSPGTTTINLPNAVNDDYNKINYRFITNQTFDGTTKVNIVGFTAGQLINSQSYYDIFQPFNSVTLFASGSAWLTTNADAQRFGDFYDTTDQTATLANTAYSMSLNSTGIFDGVRVASGSRIYADRLGIFNLQFSAQLQKNTGGDVQTYIWLAKNGTNVPNSNTNVTIAGGSGARAVAAWNFLTQYNSLNDYYELRWGSDTAGTTIEYTASPPIGPAIPSIILTLTQVG